MFDISSVQQIFVAELTMEIFFYDGNVKTNPAMSLAILYCWSWNWQENAVTPKLKETPLIIWK